MCKVRKSQNNQPFGRVATELATKFGTFDGEVR